MEKREVIYNGESVKIYGTDIPEEILVAAHSEDFDFRPLSTYPYAAVRYLHILGVRG